jgi:asparagine synthase (glutamine-hydrolysing)
MCGIVGIVSKSLGADPNGFKRLVTAMSDRLIHRGPDDSGVFVDTSSGVGLGHRRLSIVDTTSGGAQPMQTQSGRYTISYNGEIYNHVELRTELQQQGIEFRSSSDTEVLLNGIEHWGFEATLKRIVGMYAFAVLDLRHDVLHLVRDRVGEKPLYYGWCQDGFVFASELKAFEVLPNWSPSLNREALGLYFRHCYIPSPHSVYREIHKLPPACSLTIRLPENLSQQDVRPKTYWSLFDNPQAGSGTGLSLEDAVKNSVKRQMMADVPVGAFLSGGVDSATIVALMSEVSQHPVRTFTVGFGDAEFNEAAHAKKVAHHLGTDHHEFQLSGSAALDLIPNLPQMYDEPFADSSQLPTYLVSKMARSEVTVALSGDGGDELFCGYSRYFAVQRMWQRLQRFNPHLVKALAGGVGVLPNALVGLLAKFLNRVAPQAEAKFSTNRVRRLVELATPDSLDELYHGMVSYDLHPTRLLNDCKEAESIFSKAGNYGAKSNWSHMMARDLESYLPDDILTKVDRASMATSLEVRVPLLSHDVVEAAWQRQATEESPAPLPTKQALRKILYQRVPKELIERPKTGFAVPLKSWLDGPLKSWTHDLLAEDLLRRQGILNANAVTQMMREHYRGDVDHKYQLWNLVVFQSWLQRYAH